MPSDDFDDRLSRAEKIAAVVALYDTPELKLAVYQDLMGAARPAVAAPAGRRTPPKKTALAKDADSEEIAKPKAKSAGKKQSFNFDKSIDFYSKSGPSGLNFAEFSAAHPPKNTIHKAVVAVYWLAKELGLDATSVEHVYTAFKTANWVVPSDLVNTLQQAGTKNYLDSKKRDDLRLTTHGENLIEHELKPVVEA